MPILKPAKSVKAEDNKVLQKRKITTGKIENVVKRYRKSHSEINSHVNSLAKICGYVYNEKKSGKEEILLCLI